MRPRLLSSAPTPSPWARPAPIPAPLVLLPLAAFLAGCPLDEEGDCTLEAVGSVTVSVVGSDGAPLDDVAVRYAVDGEPPVACDEVGDGWVCGWERAGTFTITASAAGHTEAVAEVVVEEGACHVVPETLDLVLEPDGEPCPTEPVPAVIATVTRSDGSPLPDPEVVWAPSFTSVEQLPCELIDGARWGCAHDVTEMIDVFCYADGYHHVFVEEIPIPVDETCGAPVTVEIDVVMLPE